MSHIEISCIKYGTLEEKKGKDIESYNGEIKSKSETDDSIKLIISSTQLFMDTERFFNSVESSLKSFFDEIAKK